MAHVQQWMVITVLVVFGAVVGTNYVKGLVDQVAADLAASIESAAP